MDISKHFKYFYELDEDLQNLITSKIKNPISKELDADIINYKDAKDTIIAEYEKKGYDYDTDGMFYIYYQIENDLIRFFNDDVATNELITDNNISKLERILSIKNKLNKNKDNVINCLMNAMDNLNVISRINILIGALTCEERKQFLKLFPVNTY
jgi:hypothetical protein